MEKHINLIATFFFALFSSLLVYLLFDVSLVRAGSLALIATAVQLLCHRLFSYRSRIGFALSFLPAVFCLIYICKSGLVWVILSAAALIFLSIFYRRQYVETRTATQNWIGAAVYLIFLAFLAGMLI